MTEQKDLHLTPEQGLLPARSIDDPERAALGFSPAPMGGLALSASQLRRLTNALLMIAAVFCGWSLLRAGSINLTLSDLLLCVAIAAVLFRGEINSRPFDYLTVFWLVGLGLMLLGLLIGSLVNGSVDRWLIVGTQYLFAFLLLPMLLMGQQVSLTRNFPALFVIGIAVSQLIGISASLLFEPAETKALLGNGFYTGNGRVGAMTGEPNPNGAMIAFSLPMLLYSIRQGSMPLGIGLICGVLLIWGLLASGSFTGFSAALLALGIYLAISGFRLLLRVAVIGAIALSLFFASGLPLPAAFENRVAGALTTGDLNQAGTYTDRSALIEEAWEMVDDNTLVGLGVDQFRTVSIHQAPVHELHLLIWNEGGIVGFAGLIILLLTMFAAAFVAISRSRAEGAMIFAVIAVFNVYTVSIPHMYNRAWVFPVLLALSTYFARRTPSYLPPAMARGQH